MGCGFCLLVIVCLVEGGKMGIAHEGGDGGHCCGVFFFVVEVWFCLGGVVEVVRWRGIWAIVELVVSEYCVVCLST